MGNCCTEEMRLNPDAISRMRPPLSSPSSDRRGHIFSQSQIDELFDNGLSADISDKGNPFRKDMIRVEPIKPGKARNSDLKIF